jgi:predicted AlkP superfamily pyrophosphatase or phosphodiesterase
LADQAQKDLENRKSLSSDTAVLYGGIGSRAHLEVGEVTKEISIEPVGVIVLAIDGLRQDVLYTAEEQHVNELHVNYYVQPSELKGLCDVMGGQYDTGFLGIGSGCDSTGWESKHVKLKDVTAIFPSITLASWASIFTGKMPNETGITGNEYYARDLTFSEPVRFNNPTGMISFSSGAFKGYDAFSKMSMLLDDDFFIPSRSDWTNAVDPLDTPQNSLLMFPADTIYETITGRTEGMGLPALPGMSNVINYFQKKGGDPVVVANSHYARGSRWMTWRLDLSSGFDEILDQQSWTRFKDYIMGTYMGTDSLRNRIPFSALTVWYLPGLDHIAHVEGMETYIDYFKATTDNYIKSMVTDLKLLDEFDNKIFIIVADHGTTEMPTGLTYRDINWLGQQVDKEAEMSCEFRTEFVDPEKSDHITSAQKAEKANNNLHAWELGEILSALGGIEGASIRTKYKLLVTEEIATIFANSETPSEISPTSNIEDADIVVALNGPMAHIYSMVGTDNTALGQIAEAFRVMLGGLYSDEASQWYGFADLEDYIDFRKPTVGRLGKSIDQILIRLEDGKYYIFNGLDENGNPISGDLSNLSGVDYVDGVNRINGLNHKNRFGDIVLIMKDEVYYPETESIADHRFTSGVACKAWHGSLNGSDSYVPLIVTYPGGNINEIDQILKQDSLCKTDYSECKGNWKTSNIVKELISNLYK